MKRLLALAALAMLAPVAMAQSTCADCGVVRSVRSVVKQLQPSPATEATKPSGLVATIPLKGGKPEIGSSSKLGKDVPNTLETYEVVVRMDDGKFRVVVLDEPPMVKEGDKVHFEKGRLVQPEASK